MNIKQILRHFIVVFLIVSFVLFMNSVVENFSDAKIHKKLLGVVTVEGNETMMGGGSISMNN